MPDTVVQAAASLGGGVGLTKHICGAITGAALALGLQHARVEPTAEARSGASLHTRVLVQRFQGQFGTVNCGELTGNFEDFASRQRVYRCAELVRWAVQEAKVLLQTPNESLEKPDAWVQHYIGWRDKVT